MEIRTEDALVILKAMNDLKEEKLKLKMATKVRLNRKILMEVNDAFVASQQHALAEFGDDQENGTFNLNRESMGKFNAAMKDIMDEEITLDLHQFTIEDLGLPEDFPIKPDTLDGLDLLCPPS